MSRLHSKTYNSIRHDYWTPIDFVKILLKFLEILQFDLDVCCKYHNIPARYHYMLPETPYDYCICLSCEDFDALQLDWKKVCWMNPPYGADLKKFVQKAMLEAEKGSQIWALLPTRFVKYYIDAFRKAGFVYFMPEKVFRFGIEGVFSDVAPMPLCLVYFGPDAQAMHYRFKYQDPFKGSKYEGVLMSAA